MAPMSLRRIKAEVRRMDPNVDPESSTFRAAVVLISALYVGANADSVTGFTGYPRAEVRTFARRLTESGVWWRGRTAANWGDPKTGGIAFWMDVCVAEGLLRREPQP